MGKLEKLHIYSYAKNFSTFYCRFIGDIFFLWNGTKSELIKFIEKHILTKNTLQLDTKVYRNKNGTLCTTIYRKPSDRHNFLHYESAHPKALKDSIPYSQVLRIKRVCSETSMF